MSKTRVAQTPAEEKPKAQTVPLSNIAVTVYRNSHFIGEEGATPVTIPGDQVAILLDWFVGGHPTGDVKLFTDHGDVGLEIEALGEACRALSDANWGEYDANAILYGLHRVLEDLSLRLMAGDEERLVEKATITIQAAPAAAGGQR